MALVVLLVFAGCVEQAQDASPSPTQAQSPVLRAAAQDAAWMQVVADPEGDASVHNSDQAMALARQACNLVAGEVETCKDSLPPNSAGIVPAPPALDVVGLYVADDAHAMLFHVEFASEGSVQDYVDETGLYGTAIEIAYTSGAACEGVVWLWIQPVGGSVDAQAVHLRSHDACEPAPADPLQGRCATVNWCGGPVPWRLENGLTVEVPRGQMPFAQADQEIRFDVQVIRDSGGSRPGGWLMPGSDLGMEQVSYDGRLDGYVVDATEHGSYFTQATGDPDQVGEVLSVHEVGPWEGQIAAGDLDIQRIEFADDPRNFTWTVTLRDLDPAPRDLDLFFQFTTPAKHHYVLSAEGDGGTWTVTLAARWLPDRQVPIQLDVEASPGAPGTVTFTIPRAELPGTEAGGLMRSFLGGALRMTTIEENDGPAGYYYASLSAEAGLLVFLPPYRFGTDPAEGVALPSLEVTDLVGDVATFQDAALDPTFRPSRYDLSFADIRGTGGNRVLIQIGVTGLDDLVVPRLYDAIVYGVGLQSPGGNMMVGLRADGEGEPLSFCAPDETFLTPDPRDPGAAPGVPVEWSLLPSTGDVAGMLTFDVPPSCFGLREGDRELPVQRLSVRSALIGSPVGSAGQSPFRMADEMVDVDGGVLVFPTDDTRPSAWAQPFGVENFWDIFGVAIAVLIALASGAILVRKRLRMKRYLVELEELADRYHDEPEAYAQALVALRKRLFADLLANRLSEGHFVMVEERLRSALSSTRINSFGRDFYHLPPALMIRLQSLLADGRFSAHDHRVLKDLIGSLNIAAGSRDAVIAQIDLWAQQDQAVARLAKARRRRRGVSRS